MRIVANKIVTKWEVQAENYPSKEWLKTEIFNSIGSELRKYAPLYYENKLDGDIEYRAEVFIFSKETYIALMSQLEGILSEGEYERIKNIFMNTI